MSPHYSFQHPFHVLGNSLFLPLKILLYDRAVGWTIFTVVDLFIGVLLIDLMTTSVPAEKLQRVRIARNIGLGLLAASVIVLTVQILHRYAGGH